MASDIIYGTFTGVASTNVRPAIEWSSSSNTAGNYSDVTATLVFYRYNTTWGSFNNGGHPVSFSIDGNSASSSQTFSIAGKSREVIWTRTRRVNHTSNGSKSITIGASSTGTATSLGSYNFSGIATLDTIPRASSLTAFSMPNGLQPSVANTISLTLTRASSNFTHDIQLRDGNTVIQSWIGQGLPTTLSIGTGQVNTLLSRMSSVTKRTLTLRVQTKSGGTNIGSALTRTATATVSSTVEPTATGLTVAISGSGKDDSLKKYVQNVTRVYSSFTGSATGGATVITRNITIRKDSGKGDSQVINGASGTTGREVRLNGLYEAIATVVDSRGRSKQQRIEFTVDAYAPPQITKFSATRRSATPTTVDIVRNATHSHLGGGNVLTLLTEKSTNGTTFTTVQSTTSAVATSNATLASTGHAVASSHYFRFTLTDQFGNGLTVTDTVSTQKVVLDIHKNEGVGIGKIHERGDLDVNGNAFFEGTIDVAGRLKADRIELNSGISSDFPALLIKGNAADHGLRTRGIDGASSSGTLGDLYLNSNSDGKVFIGASQDEVVSSGANSNGSWVRFYDGTQICKQRFNLGSRMTMGTGASSDLYRTDTTDWQYPMAFSTATNLEVVGSPEINTGTTMARALTYVNRSSSATTTSQCQVFALTSHTNDVSVYVRLIAIGRWK